MKRFVCKVCGYAYDPEVGDSEHGIAPGTAFENLPEIQFAAFRLRDAAFFMLRPL